MGRLKTLPSRLSAAPSRLKSAPKSEPERLRQREAERPNWYGTSRWKRLRLTALKRDNWTCQKTGALLVGKYPAANSPAVDHINPHQWDPELFWDLSNLQSVSKHWHDSYKQSLDRGGKRPAMRPDWIKPSAIPVTVVCGPPASGKSRYVSINQSVGDIVIDLDAIVAEVSGQPFSHDWDRDRWLHPAIWSRNALIGNLCEEHQANAAWIVMTGAKASDRKWWHDKVQAIRTIVIEATELECLAHANKDADRDQAHTGSSVMSWWNQYERGQGEEILTPKQIRAG